MSDPTTWRDLAAQLTPEQIAEFERYEQLPPGVVTADTALAIAQSQVRENQAPARCAHIPTPGDAIGEPSRWMPWDGDVCQRVYTCWEQRVTGVEVKILGYQYSDDRPIYREIFFDGTDNCDITADRARALGRLLVEAGDKLDQLDGITPPFM